MVNEDIIFCYSGTGNSLASAKQLSEALDIPIRHITRELVEERSSVECGVCIIICPVYAFGLPVTVREFLKATSFNVGYFAFFATCGSYGAGVYGEVKRLLKRKNQKLHYSRKISAVENFVHVFGFPKEKKAAYRTALQSAHTAEVIQSVKERVENKTNSFTPFSCFVSALFRMAKPFFAKFYKIKDSCNGCGLCQKICPARAITQVKKDGVNKPAFKARLCDHCQSCMQLCPQKAIKFFRVTPKSPRYLHKDIEMKELIKPDR